MLSKIGFAAACLASMVSATPETRYATCTLSDNDDLLGASPGDGYDVSGVIAFKEERNGDLQITAVVEGLKTEFFHGFHIHAFGDISQGCKTGTKGHFNPEGVNHGEWSNFQRDRHDGDLRGLQTDANGRADY